MPINISVVIPTYQRPQLLKQCLEALLGQQFSKDAYEVIVVTDGMDNETMAYVDEYKKKHVGFFVSCFSLPEKRGPAAARNMGWQKAKGQLIAFTDDDTLPSPQWLNALWKARQSSHSEKIAFSGKVIVPLDEHPTDYARNTAGLEKADFITANCACTKQALQRVNGFDEDFTMAWREDSELEFKLLKHRISIMPVPEALIIHPVRNATWGISLKEQKKSMFNALLYKKHPALFKQKIYSRPLWNYYTMLLLFIISFISIILHYYTIAIVAAVSWLLLAGLFAAKRLQDTSHSFTHVAEMIITSLLIPFVSVYWTLYGAVKFKVFFL